MRYWSKALKAGGLALVVGPFCVAAQAQEVIDLEAERERAERSQQQGGQRPDPYAPQPARAYPATNFGVRSTPAAGDQQAAPQGLEPTGQLTASSTAAPVPVAAASGGNIGELYLTVQRLQQEVMRLNGIVEEQANELRSLREQNLERYVDLDRRLGLLAGADPAVPGGDSAGATSAGGAGSGASTASPSGSAAAPAVQGAGAGNVAEQPGERDAYQAAYNLVREQQFAQAIGAFQQFLQKYPAGRYSPNAFYWLGELHLVTQPPDIESARESFMLLLELYPQDQKVPDALFKLGKLHFERGERDKAREFLDRVIAEFGSSSSGAVNLARDFLRANY